MSDLFWSSDAQMARLQPCFPKFHGRLRVDDAAVRQLTAQQSIREGCDRHAVDNDDGPAGFFPQGRDLCR